VIYPWLKALHVAAILTWMGGLLLVAMTIQAFARAKVSADGASMRSALVLIHRWDRYVTSPAMLLAWGLGIAIAMQGGWFGALWLTLKLGFAVFLSAMHGIAAGTLKRLVRGGQPASSFALRHLPLATVASMVVVAVLAVVKPF
jgi:putative membrane protein